MTVFLVSAVMEYDQKISDETVKPNKTIYSCMLNFSDGGVDLFTPEGFEILHRLIHKKFMQENTEVVIVHSVQMIAVSNLGNKMLPPEVSGNA